MHAQPSIINHQSSMRKAFTLVELLMLVSVLPIVMIAISGVYATLIRDIPRTTRVLQQNTVVLDLLRQIGRDMDQATGLPEQFDGQHTGAHVLLIEQSGRVIRYEFQDGQVVRTLLSGALSEDRGPKTEDTVASNPQSAIRNSQSPERLWRMPEAVVTWQPWTRDGEARAIEVRSHVRERVAGRLTEKLAGSYVFFVDGLGSRGKR
jgi:type II secretory pathway pseudopilin PulG